MKRLVLALLFAPTLAHAGAWTRDQGHFYLGTSYLRISAERLYAPDFQVVPIVPYTQHVWSFYGEVGLVTRWLTATVDGTVFRWNQIAC